MCRDSSWFGFFLLSLCVVLESQHVMQRKNRWLMGKVGWDVKPRVSSCQASALCRNKSLEMCAFYFVS